MRRRFCMFAKHAPQQGRKTLERHARRFKAMGYALALTKRTGREAALDDEGKKILILWISEQNLNNEPLDLSAVRDFISLTFDISVPRTTCYDLLRSIGCTTRT